MRISVRSLVLMAALLVAAFGLSACFQEASTGVQPTQLGGELIVPPSPTPDLPTQVPASPTPFELPTLTPGEPSEAIPGVESGLEDGQGGFTSTLVPTQDTAETTGQEVAVVPTATPVLGGQAVSGPAQTATAIILGAAGQFPTATEPAAQQLGGEMTATALIVGATETAYARETATATAMGILPPTQAALPTNILTPTPTVDSTGDCTYVVRPGDNLYRISLRYGISLEQLTAANGITNAAVIRVGRELVIPGCGQLTPTPDGGGDGGCVADTHYIQPGDNLYRLSLRYGVSLGALQNANNLASIHHIVAGRTLVIPCP